MKLSIKIKLEISPYATAGIGMTCFFIIKKILS